jgi:Flp pilus assembly protein TadD
MNKAVALKFAVSALALGTTMVACKPAAQAFRPASASTVAVKSDVQAADAFARARARSQTGDIVGAVALAEQAVELSPRDAGYRLQLADLYLKTGRFQSAEATYGDVLTLDPGNPRASLAIALASIATGRNDAAVERLETIAETAPPSDVGLAFALAGQPQRAIELLEPAARASGADGRLRQNLALAYALAGDWEKAKTTAAQDVSPAELQRRLSQWAALARPSAQSERVAAILGVRAAPSDLGQPVRLALAPPAGQAYAAAEPAPEPAPVAAAALAPVRSAEAEIPAWVPAAQAPAAPREETRPVYADAVQSLVAPQPAVMPAPKLAPVRHFDRPVRLASASATQAAAPGRFAVQLGAFSSAAGVERAWAKAYRRYGFESHTPLSTTYSVAGRPTLHRLSVAGFASRGEADRTCRLVRAKGGVCFVRAVAGDAPVQWAGRYAGTGKA